MLHTLRMHALARTQAEYGTLPWRMASNLVI